MTGVIPPDRSEQERLAAFDEMMREEILRGERVTKPVNGLAVFTLIVGLLGGLLALVFGPLALFQMKYRGQRGLAFVVVGLAACVAWMAAFALLWRPDPAALPVSGLDLKAGECFDAPEQSGEVDDFRLPCADGPDGKAFAVIALPYDEYPGVVEHYDDALARCGAAASAGFAEIIADGDVRVQVMTHTPRTWKTKPHRVVCYFNAGRTHLG